MRPHTKPYEFCLGGDEADMVGHIMAGGGSLAIWESRFKVLLSRNREGVFGQGVP